MAISSSGALLWMTGEGGSRLPCRGPATLRTAAAEPVAAAVAPATQRRAVGPALRWPALAPSGADETLDLELAEALALAVGSPPPPSA